ncbi:MAG: sulfur carrier protein ThiS [Dehalococcoidia bacterium]
MVNLTVNGEPRTLPEESTLPDFLTSLQLDGRRIAVAHNGTVLYREDWPSVMLREGDRLEIVRMIGGGADEATGKMQ